MSNVVDCDQPASHFGVSNFFGDYARVVFEAWVGVVEFLRNVFKN